MRFTLTSSTDAAAPRFLTAAGSPAESSRADRRVGQQLGEHAAPAVVVLIDAIASSVELARLRQIAFHPTLQLGVDWHAGQMLEVAAHAAVETGDVLRPTGPIQVL